MPAVWETQVRSLDQEDLLEAGMAARPSISPGGSHGQRGLAGCSPWGRAEPETTDHRAAGPALVSASADGD